METPFRNSDYQPLCETGGSMAYFSSMIEANVADIRDTSELFRGLAPRGLGSAPVIRWALHPIKVRRMEWLFSEAVKRSQIMDQSIFSQQIRELEAEIDNDLAYPV